MPTVSVNYQYDNDTHEAFLLPRHIAAVVHELLAQDMQPTAAPLVALKTDGAPSAPLAPAAQCAVHVDGQGDWTSEMVERLADHVVTPVTRRAIDFIAERAPAVVSYPELLEGAGAQQYELRAALAGLSRLTSRLFEGTPIWPMTARQGLSGGTVMGYRMPRAVAEWWLAARKAVVDAALAESPA